MVIRNRERLSRKRTLTRRISIMAFVVNVSASKKVGGPEFSSRGAGVSFQAELDAGVVADLSKLRAKIRELFDVARTAVCKELNRNGAPVPPPNANGVAQDSMPVPGHTPRPASEKQAR